MALIYQDNSLLTYDQWLANRIESLGASEIGAVVIGSKWSSNLEIFYQKVTGKKKDMKSLRSYIGHQSENICDGMYPYYEGNDDSIWINKERGRMLRKIINKNRTIKNTDIPHITVTPDREIVDDDGKIIGCVEYKNTQSYIVKQYKDELPPENIYQLASQVNVGKFEKGELFYFLDNRTCRLYSAEKKYYRSMWNQILDITIPFWENVYKGRKIYNAICEAKRNYNIKLANQLEFELAQLEPPPQISDGYLKFLNENFKDRFAEGKIIPGNTDLLIQAKKYRDLELKISKLEKQKQQSETILKDALRHHNRLDFGAEGFVDWRLYPESGRRIFKINMK